MATNDYHFIEHWTVPGATAEEVWAVISDGEAIPYWWKGVYLESEALGQYSGPELGARYRVKARGFLPYRLRFILETTELEPGRMLEVRATGDFTGSWRAEIVPEADGVRVNTDWRVIVEKPLIRWLSPVLKPLFAWNHRWTTPRGEEGLRAYIAEQRARATQATAASGS